MVFLHDQGCNTIQIVGHLHTPYLMSCWKTLKRRFLIRPENVRPAIAGLIYFQFRRNLWYLPKCRHQTIANHSSMGVRTFFSIWAKQYVSSFSQCNANIVQIDNFWCVWDSNTGPQDGRHRRRILIGYQTANQNAFNLDLLFFFYSIKLVYVMVIE